MASGTRSHLHALRYKLTFDRYLRSCGYTDIKALVAFSGDVSDPDLGGERFTDAGMNGIPESKLPEEFGKDGYAADERLAEQARANDEEHYSVGFDDAFDDAVVDLVLRNERLFAKLQDDPGFQRLVKDYIRPRVYGRQRAAD